MTLQIKNLSYSYKNSDPILSNLSINIQKGEFVSLIGKSGCGKSTLFKLITGLLHPDSGEILINNKKATIGTFGYMPQRDLLLPWRTVLENLMLVAEIRKDSGFTKDTARTWLKKVGLSDWETAFPSELSGGMKQRVAFLRTILMGSDILLLDEPFGALDSFTKREMQSWLLSIWKELDKTILFITHDIEEAIILSDKIMIFHQQHFLEELRISLPRPREVEMVHSTKIQEYRKELEKRISNG